jgi:hypothetical protein
MRLSSGLQALKNRLVAGGFLKSNTDIVLCVFILYLFEFLIFLLYNVDD